MEEIHVVLHKSKHGKRHTAVGAYRDEEDAQNERRAIDDHTVDGSVQVDTVTLDGAVSANALTGRDAYSPGRKP
jgi:hypothetical protein